MLLIGYYKSLMFFSYQPIVDYIESQFEAYLQEELKIKRSFTDYHDSRVHVCLYFISPTGHSLKSLDLLTMKNIDSKVCLVNPSTYEDLIIILREYVFLKPLHTRIFYFVMCVYIIFFH